MIYISFNMLAILPKQFAPQVLNRQNPNQFKKHLALKALL